MTAFIKNYILLLATSLALAHCQQKMVLCTKLCLGEFHCEGGGCVPNKPECQREQDCKPNEDCISGRCVNRPQPECRREQDCKPNQDCVGGRCVDKSNKPCFNCKFAQRCVNGQCIPSPIDRCAIIACIDGFICQNGNCIKDPNYCRLDSDCPYPLSCVNNKCFNKCSVVRCRAGYECVRGNCVDMCLRMVCPRGYSCFEGNCIPPVDVCNNDRDCKKNERCERGTCVDKCLNVACLYGSPLFDECCRAKDCSKVLCPPGSVCKSGVCIPDLVVCPVAEYNATFCPDPRPNEQTCPAIFYIRPPEPLFCGVKADGSRVDFARDCQACKDRSIVYYFYTPCSRAPKVCKSNLVCLWRDCVLPARR